MTGYRIRAALHLKSAGDGGLKAPLPAGTRSIHLRFADGARQAAPATLGAVITPCGAVALAPGERLEAQLLLWAGDAAIHAAVGASFELWYGGRIVGHGVVISKASAGGNREWA